MASVTRCHCALSALLSLRYLPSSLLPFSSPSTKIDRWVKEGKKNDGFAMPARSPSVAVGAWLATQVARVLTEQPFVFACSARLFLPLCLSSDRRTSPPLRLTRCSRWKIARSKEGSSSQESQLPTNEGITRNEVERRSGVACNNYASPIGAPLPCRVGLTTAGSRRGGIIVV